MAEGKKRGRGRSEGNENPVFTQVRIDESTFLRGKVLAAIYNESFNQLMVEAIRHEIQKYEDEHGSLPKPEPKYVSSRVKVNEDA